MRAALVLVLVLLNASPAQAGAWLQPKGQGLFIAQATYFTSSDYYDNDGALQPQDTFTKHELQPYVEYGVSNTLTIGGSVYLNQVNQAGDDNIGMANPELFARTRMWHDGTQTLSLQPLLKLPSVYRDDRTPRGGAKSTDLELSVLYGRNVTLISPRDYIDTRIGYRWRSRGREPQLLADGLIGLQVSEHWQMITAMRQIISQDVSPAFSENGDQDYESLKAEFTAQYTLDDRRTLHATFFDHIDGRMAGAGRGLTLGVGVRF